MEIKKDIDNVNTLDIMRKLDENFSYILYKLNNVQRILSAYSQETVDDCIQTSLQECVFHDFPFGLNDEILWLSGGKLEEISGISAYKVFAEIPFRDADMKVANSMKHDVVKPKIKVFDERFHTISTVMCDSSNLIMFDEMLFALSCKLSACSSSNGIIAHLNENRSH
ncbi:hypothetical protein H5410_012202 [Solanum commersonii]|uniref:Uncharacterized protein n=1 Tax=Solanum commersonii TaxID=4109 RepID=A0A9J6AQR6_SOLCO|nr:hypothetical protein H5410_012202 [Solanum commersonii]